MDFHAGLEEHPSPGPLQKGNGTVRRSLPVSAHKWECQEHPGPVGKGRVQQQPQIQSPAGSFSQAPAGAAEQHRVLPGWSTAGISPNADPREAVSNSLCQAGLSCCCCFWILLHPIPAAQGTLNFCHVCSQHTGSGSCSLQLLLLQQDLRFYGANFIEDQMNPVFSSTSTDQPTALIPFCQKMGRNKRPIT